METRGTALLTHEIPAAHAITTTISREEIASVLQDRNATPELTLDLVYGEEQSTIGISWSYGELESLFERSSDEDIILTFDRNELQSLFDDVEAHGLRERALVFTVAVVGALGSGATIANAAPTIGDNPGAPSVAAVESMAAQSIDGVASNVHTPGLQTGDESSTASAPSANVSAAKVADDTIMSNVRTPGLQTGDEVSSAPTASLRVSAGDGGIVSNVHTPGLQIGDETSTGSVPAVHVSTSSSDGEFLGIDTRDATEALIAGGILLAAAGATFAGARRPGSARPA